MGRPVRGALLTGIKGIIKGHIFRLTNCLDILINALRELFSFVSRQASIRF